MTSIRKDVKGVAPRLLSLPPPGPITENLDDFWSSEELTNPRMGPN